MKKTVFGFDLGIASIGWAAVKFDDETFNPETGEIAEGTIIDCGVRCFPVAENPKDGSSLALPRRQARLARRCCRRKARRMQTLKNIFISYGLAKNKNEINDIYAHQIGGDVWKLRVKALGEQLSKEELLRVLTHLAKHRGFLSYRKAEDEEDKEGGKILKAIKDNKDLLFENKRLVQIIVERAGECGPKRNRAKDKKEPIYVNSIPREEIKEEVKRIFEVQKQYGIFSQSLYDDYCKRAFYYHPNGSVENMVGFCRFEKEEKRAPKEAPTSELFVALTKINNMSLNDNGKLRNVTPEEREKIITLLKNQKTVKYTTLSRKVFGDSIIFRDINYNQTTKKMKNGEIKEINPEDVIFYEMKGWHKLKSVFSAEEWTFFEQDIPLLDQIVTIIAYHKNDADIIQKLEELKINPEYIKKFTKLLFSTFINLSLKALYKILPHMKDGAFYNEACDKVGYDFRKSEIGLVAQKGLTLSPILPTRLTTVPVVNRTVAQFRKVYNEMVRRFGLPDQINIETGQELKKNHEERKNIERKNEENYQERKLAEDELSTNQISGTSKNILKCRLYKEQSGKCIYSGQPIELSRLEENGYLDVDHVIPYSRSLDNSYNNKVLCLSSENRKKSNQTPYEYFTDCKTPEQWECFEVRVKMLHNRNKENNLLNKSFKDRELEFRERNANDNSHIARFVKQYCEEGIDFSSSQCSIKNRIQVRNGALTDYLRHQWGLKKNRNKSDLHHAQDAIVIACATQAMVQKLSKLSSIFENKEEFRKRKAQELGHDKAEAWYNYIKSQVQEPWYHFRNDVLSALDKIFVSRPPRKSATGEIHQETIRTLNPKHKKYNEQDVKSGIKIRGGIASNGSMLRTDVFVKKNKKGKDEFYLVPIYLSDMGKDLPCRAIVSGKTETEWLLLDNSYLFKFSLYMDDLVKVTKGEKEILGYFKGADRSNGAITLVSHDRQKLFRGIGVKTQELIQKFQVGVLGDIHEIKQETRVPINNIKSNKQKMREKRLKKQG